LALFFFGEYRWRQGGEYMGRTWTILTNNDLLVRENRPGLTVKLVSEDAGRVLMRARDLIHGGWRLVSHPLAGGVTANPYRSVVLEAGAGPVDYQSLILIEQAIAGWSRQATLRGGGLWGEGMREDLKFLDQSLLPVWDDDR